MLDFELIPESAYHDAVQAALGDCRLQRGFGQYNLRCPICGGSKSDLRSRNTHVYFDGGKFYYHCFQGRCIKKMPFSSFLKQHYPHIWQNLISYALVKRRPLGEKKKEQEIRNFFFSGLTYFDNGELIKITSGHPTAISAMSEVIRRKIPKKYWSEWFVAVKSPQYSKMLGGKGNTFGDRIIIPFYKRGGGWSYFQGRDLSGKHPAKYLNPEKDREIYRIDFVDWNRRFYITEGPIDSCFIDNAIATGGSAGLKQLIALDKFNAHRRNAVFITDNFNVDDTGRADHMKLMRRGYTTFDWSKVENSTDYKDINDLVMSGTVPLNDDGTIMQSYIDERIIVPTALTPILDKLDKLSFNIGI